MSAPHLLIAPSPRVSLAPALEAARVVTAGVRGQLRLEALAAFGAAIALYGHAGLSWPAFLTMFLTPDIAMIA